MNRDFDEMLSIFIALGVEFLIVDAYALAAHGWPRATGDIDLWIRPSEDNANRAWQALEEFGAPLGDLTAKDLSTSGVVLQIGVAPARIDILTQISGVTFDEAWSKKADLEVEGRVLPFISLEDLIRNKRATGRTKDLADLEDLQR